MTKNCLSMLLVALGLHTWKFLYFKASIEAVITKRASFFTLPDRASVLGTDLSPTNSQLKILKQITSRICSWFSRREGRNIFLFKERQSFIFINGGIDCNSWLWLWGYGYIQFCTCRKNRRQRTTEQTPHGSSKARSGTFSIRLGCGLWLGSDDRTESVESYLYWSSFQNAERITATKKKSNKAVFVFMVLSAAPASK